MNRSRNARRGILSGMINNILRLFFPFVNRTVILYLLGVEYLGIGGLFTSILQVLNITELGFGSAIAYILYKPISEDDTETINAILAFARKIFRYIGFSVLGLGLLCLPFIKKLISGDMPDNLNIYLLFLLYLANSSISYFLFSYKRVLLSAAQRYDLETTIGSIVLIAQNIFQLIVLLIWKNFYLYVIVFLISTILSNILCDYITKRKFPQYFCKGHISSDEISLVKRTIRGIFVSRFGSVMFSSVNNIVISSLFGLVLLGQYTNYYYISSCIVGFFAIIHNSLRPVLGNCFITESKQRMFCFLKDISFIYNWASAFCACCMMCLYQDFIILWAGNNNVLPLKFAILMSFSFFIGRVSSIPTVFVEAAGLYDESKYVYLTAGLLNLILNLIMATFFGIEGIVIATISTNILVCLGGYAYVLFKNYFHEYIFVYQYIRTIIPATIIQSSIIISAFFLSRFIKADNLYLFAGKTVSIIMIFTSFFLVYSAINKSRIKDLSSYYNYITSF